MLKRCHALGVVQWASSRGTIFSRGKAVEALKGDVLSIGHQEVLLSTDQARDRMS